MPVLIKKLNNSFGIGIMFPKTIINPRYRIAKVIVKVIIQNTHRPKLEDVSEADIVLLGVSRTSKTPTSMYLANRGYKTANIPLVMDQRIPECLKSKSNRTCIVGLVTDPERLADVRRNRVTIMKENDIKEYTDLNFIKEEINKSKKLFKKYNWPVIDVTRKSVEESAASILKIYEIQKSK